MKPNVIDEFHASPVQDGGSVCHALCDGIDDALPEAESRVWHVHLVWFLDGNPVVRFIKLKRFIGLMFGAAATLTIRP